MDPRGKAETSECKYGKREEKALHNFYARLGRVFPFLDDLELQHPKTEVFRPKSGAFFFEESRADCKNICWSGGDGVIFNEKRREGRGVLFFCERDDLCNVISEELVARAAKTACREEL